MTVPFGILLGFFIPQIKQHPQLSSRAWLATPVIFGAMALILLVALSNAQFILPTAAGYVLESEADDPKWTHYGASAGGDSYSSAAFSSK